MAKKESGFLCYVTMDEGNLELQVETRSTCLVDSLDINSKID